MAAKKCGSKKVRRLSWAVLNKLAWRIREQPRGGLVMSGKTRVLVDDFGEIIDVNSRTIEDNRSTFDSRTIEDGSPGPS